MKTVKERTCIVCRKKGQKQDFLRIVKTPQNTIIVDQSHKANGRGAYVCKNLDCITKCQKTKALNRAFKTEVGEQIYSDIRQYIDDKN